MVIQKAQVNGTALCEALTCVFVGAGSPPEQNGPLLHSSHWNRSI